MDDIIFSTIYALLVEHDYILQSLNSVL